MSDTPDRIGPAALAANRPVRDAWRALLAAAALALALHADAAPGWMLDAGAPVWAFEAAQAASDALSFLRAPRDALAEAAAALRP